jgi:O-antigen ligase
MKTKPGNIKRSPQNSGVVWWLVGGASLITLYFNSKIQDPFNAPKFWLLILISSWLTGHLLFNKRKINNSGLLKKFVVILAVLNLLLLITAFLTDVKYVAFFGENQRRTGFLTYLSLSIISLSAATFIRRAFVNRLMLVIFITGLTLGAYGLMQTTGNDFVSWNNPYNSIISTVGNPNFAAAIMAVMGTLIFGLFVNSENNLLLRFISLILSFALLIIISLSDARQGLIAYAVGIGSLIIVWSFSFRKKLGILVSAAAGAVGIFSILGMLQIGPLTSLLYKPSVTVRGYYWRAGMEMLEDNFFTGVGIDRYGAYFKQYREVGYPLKYGFDITSSNAHNLPIQLFATGGFLVGLAYLVFTIFVFITGFKSIKNTSGGLKLSIATVFAGWLAYQAQSLVSIDNIGISVWGWLLAGTVIGLSVESNDEKRGKSVENLRITTNKINVQQPLISGTLLIIAIVLTTTLFKGEANMFDTRTRYNPSIEANRAPLHEYALKTINSRLVEPNYKMMSASYLITTGFTDEGFSELQKVNKLDPRNLDSLTLLADFSEQLGRIPEAINYRESIIKLDPWNANNYYKLGIYYKSQGDLSKMQEMREKVLSFAANTEVGKSSAQELVVSNK